MLNPFYRDFGCLIDLYLDRAVPLSRTLAFSNPLPPPFDLNWGILLVDVTYLLLAISSSRYLEQFSVFLACS